jgi:hypothetical protein
MQRRRGAFARLNQDHEPAPTNSVRSHGMGRGTVHRTAIGAGKFPIARCLGILVYLSAFSIGHAARGDVSDDPAAPVLLSKDAVIALEVPSPGRLIDRLTDPRIQDFLVTLPQYRKALEGKPFRDVASIIKVVAAQLNTTWDKGLKDLTGGGIFFALEAPESKAPHFVLIIKPKDETLPDRVLKALLKLVRQDTAGKGKPDPIKTSDHRGTAIYSPADQPQVGLAIQKGRLLVSNSKKALASLIDRGLDGPGPAGAKSASPNARAPASGRDENHEWKALRDRKGPDAIAWGFARMDAVRKLDPKRYAAQGNPDTGQVLFFGSWIEALKQASVATASLDWSESELSATLELPRSSSGLPAKVKGYVPGPDAGAAPLIQPPGTLASLSLWRDWATIWDSRADLFPPEVVQNLAQFDSFAGQFFGGREFGTDVLGALDPHWRLIVARQDYQSLKPAPDVKLPAFAIVAELNAPEGDFAQRLKIAFQALIGISNVEAIQNKAVPLELGSEEVEGVTLATSRYVLPQASPAANVTPQQRYNFSPSAARVGKFFVLSSSSGLARLVIKELNARGAGTIESNLGKETLVIEADGPELARLLEINAERLAMETMLSRGETNEKARAQVQALLSFVRYLGHGRLTIRDEPATTRLDVKLRLWEQK